MGYDCTLHVIDEAALTRFAAELTGKSAPKGDAGYFKKVRAFLDAKDADAALAVTELALLRASATGPHLTTRGVALSLWDTKVLGPAPWKLFGSLERGPLSGLLGKWPALKGRVPTMFESNYCTGVFVSAAEVPALLAELERRFSSRPKGTTREWAPVLKLLRIAARHRHAYWEGTDLAVRQGHREWLDEEKPRAKAKLRAQRVPFGLFPRLLAADGETAVVSNLDTYCTWVVDLRAWPPKVTTYRGLFSADAAISRGGRIALRASTDSKERPRRFHLHVAESASKKPRASGALEEAQHVRFLGETPMAFSRQPGEGPWLLAGSKLTKARGLPRSVGYRNAIRLQEVAFDTGTFGDGTPLLVWDGSVYVKKGAKLALLAKAKLRPESYSGSSTLALDADTLLMLDDRKLVTVSRDGRLERPFKKAKNVMAIRNAADGAVVLHQGDHDEGHAAKVWWPSRREFAGVEFEDLGVDEVSWLVWAREPRLLVVCANGKLIALEAETIFSKQRARDS